MAKCQNIKIKIIKSLDGVSIAIAALMPWEEYQKVSTEVRTARGGPRSVR